VNCGRLGSLFVQPYVMSGIKLDTTGYACRLRLCLAWKGLGEEPYSRPKFTLPSLNNQHVKSLISFINSIGKHIFV